MWRNVKLLPLECVFLVAMLPPACTVEEIPRSEDRAANGISTSEAEAPMPRSFPFTAPDTGGSEPVAYSQGPDPDPRSTADLALEDVGDRTRVEVQDRFWAGPETHGAELVGEFVTAEAMKASLSLDAPIVSLEDRDWVLGDVLVSLEILGPGDVAAWRVVGPASVIEAYVSRLREDVEKRGALLDLGILPLEVEHCCPPQGAEDPPG